MLVVILIILVLVLMLILQWYMPKKFHWLALYLRHNKKWSGTDWHAWPLCVSQVFLWSDLIIFTVLLISQALPQGTIPQFPQTSPNQHPTAPHRHSQVCFSALLGGTGGKTLTPALSKLNQSLMHSLLQKPGHTVPAKGCQAGKPGSEHGLICSRHQLS